MAINQNKVFSTLNDLIETLKDGEQGFKTAADAVEQSDLKNLFQQYAMQRQEYIGELQGLMKGMDADATSSGSITGAMHRGWMDIKSAVSSRDTKAILNECERGEDHAVKEYSDALNEELPSNIKSVISDQFNGIKAVHDRVKQLRDMNRT